MPDVAVLQQWVSQHGNQGGGQGHGDPKIDLFIDQAIKYLD
jgi:hypothetical protein